MAEKLCELRKKGGGSAQYTETSLWTNSTPTSSFAEQTVTLSQSVDNFKYIAVKYKAHTSSEDSTKFIISTDDLKKGVNTTTNHNICFVGSQTSGASYSRIIFYISSTSLSINTAYRTNRTESNNAYAIPLEILGLNELDHGRVNCDTGSVSVTTGTVATVTLGYKPKYLSLTFNPTPSNSNANKMDFTYNEDMSTGYTIRSLKQNTSTVQCNSYAVDSSSPLILNNDGFSINIGSTSTWAGTWYYFAIGETSV